jgi:hypothetical protein
MPVEPEQALAAAKAGACLAHAKWSRPRGGPRTPELPDLRALAGQTDPVASRMY